MNADNKERVKKEILSASLWPKLCSTWDRFGVTNVARWTKQIWFKSKGIPVVRHFTHIAELGVNLLVLPVVIGILKPVCNKLPTQVGCIADCAVSTVESLEHKCFGLVQKVLQVFSHIKQYISYLLACLLQRVLQSTVGQIAWLLLDLLIGLSEAVIDMIAPELANEEVLMGGGGNTHSKDGGLRTVSTSHKQQRKANNKGTGGEVVAPDKSFLNRLLTGLLLTPLRALVFVVTSARQFMLRYSAKPPVSPSSSLKQTKLLNRKKLSPKKRLGSRSYLRRFMLHALHVLGVRQMTKFPPRYMKLKAANATSREQKCQEATGLAIIPERERTEKRRHSDVSSASLSDTEVLELMQDMEGYVSEEDPDFTPVEQASVDSLEFVEGDTESFIDLEDEDIEPPKHTKRVSIQVKDVKTDAEKSRSVVQIADDVVKFEKKETTKEDSEKRKQPQPGIKDETEKAKPVLQRSENVKSEKKDEQGKVKSNEDVTKPSPKSTEKKIQPDEVKAVKSKRASESDTATETKSVQEKKLRTDVKANGHKGEPFMNGKADKENQAPLRQLSPKKGLHPQNTSSPKVMQMFSRKASK